MTVVSIESAVVASRYLDCADATLGGNLIPVVERPLSRVPCRNDATCSRNAAADSAALHKRAKQYAGHDGSLPWPAVQ